jgi:hypothetical protein
MPPLRPTEDDSSWMLRCVVCRSSCLHYHDDESIALDSWACSNGLLSSINGTELNKLHDYKLLKELLHGNG